MKAVMYGGGNIGRGFIGALFSESGYRVTFVDVSEPLVASLHQERSYPLRIVSNEGHHDVEITNVDAIDGNDTAAVAGLIAEADVMATAVGAGILKYIAPNLAAGIRERFKKTDRPLDVIICENLMDADKLLRGMIKEHLTEDERRLLDERVGLVEASVGRMVPVQTSEMQDGNPLRVCVERYCFLPVDKDAFKGPVPDIRNMIPASPFSFYIKRKLFLHNMGHALCAYLGLFSGSKFIYEAIDNPQILLIVKSAMLEIVEALGAEYGEPIPPMLRHMDDLLFRFTNRALGDTCARVGHDSTRKLAPSDRLIGAAKLCVSHGITPAHIAVGAAGALYHLSDESGTARGRENALEALRTISGLESDNELTRLIMDMYTLYLSGASPEKMRKSAQQIACSRLSGVV